MSEFNTVEDNMRKRRKEATSLLGENQALCTITSFPRLVPVSTCMAGISEHPGIKRADHNPPLDPTALMLCRQFILITLCLVESVTLELQAVICQPLPVVVVAGGTVEGPEGHRLRRPRGRSSAQGRMCVTPRSDRGPPDGGAGISTPRVC